jgi:hypothetical protein
MLTPIITEIHRVPEPVVRDTFISEFDGPTVRRPDPPSNIVSLAAHRSRRHPAAVPARAA